MIDKNPNDTNLNDQQCLSEEKFFEDLINSHFQKRIELLTNLLENPIVQLFDELLKEYAESEKRELGAFLLPYVDAWGFDVPTGGFISERIKEAVNFQNSAKTRRRSLAEAMTRELTNSHLQLLNLSKDNEEAMTHGLRLQYKELVDGWFSNLDYYYLSKIEKVQNLPDMFSRETLERLAKTKDVVGELKQLLKTHDLVGEAGDFYNRFNEVRDIEFDADLVQFGEPAKLGEKSKYFSGVSDLMYEMHRIQMIVVPEAIRNVKDQFDVLQKSVDTATKTLKQSGPIKNFFNRWFGIGEPTDNSRAVIEAAKKQAKQIEKILDKIRSDLDGLHKIIKSHEILERFEGTKFKRFFFGKLDYQTLQKIQNLEKGFNHYEAEWEKLNRSIRKKRKATETPSFFIFIVWS